MSKTILYFAASFLAVLAGGCSSADSPERVDDERLYDVSPTVNLEIKTTTDTRGRQLTTTDCRQNADDVRIYVFRSDDGAGDESFTLYNPGDEFMKPEEDWAIPHIYVPNFEGGDLQDCKGDESYSLTINPKLEEGYYRFLAVARDDDETDGRNFRSIDWSADEESATKWTETFLSNSGNPMVTEFFSGFATKDGETQPHTIHVAGNGAFETEITLRRAVAGVYLYVENVPEKVISEFDRTGIKKGEAVAVTEVAVVAVSHDKSLNLLTRRYVGDFVDAPANDFVKLASVNVTDNNRKAPDPDGKFVFPVNLTDKKVSMGEETPSTSLALCFYHDGFPIKLLPIKMARTVDMHPDEFSQANEVSEDGCGYNLLANHLYCLGNKNEDEGIDNPVDLEEALRDHTLEITVIGAWQADVNINMDNEDETDETK